MERLNVIKGRIAVEMGIVEMYCGVLDVYLYVIMLTILVNFSVL